MSITPILDEEYVVVIRSLINVASLEKLYFRAFETNPLCRCFSPDYICGGKCESSEEMIPLVVAGLYSKGWSVNIHGIIVNTRSFFNNRGIKNGGLGSRKGNPGEVVLVFVATSPMCKQRTCTEKGR